MFHRNENIHLKFGIFHLFTMNIKIDFSFFRSFPFFCAFRWGRNYHISLYYSYLLLKNELFEWNIFDGVKAMAIMAYYKMRLKWKMIMNVFSKKSESYRWLHWNTSPFQQTWSCSQTRIEIENLPKIIIVLKSIGTTSSRICTNKCHMCESFTL